MSKGANDVADKKSKMDAETSEYGTLQSHRAVKMSKQGKLIKTFSMLIIYFVLVSDID